MDAGVLSSSPASPGHQKGLERPDTSQGIGRPVPTRRDTGQSLNIDYYFSREANGNGPSSSNSLSTAMSVSSSASSSQMRVPSANNLRSLEEETEQYDPLILSHSPESHLREGAAMDPSGPTNRRIQVHQLASSSSSSLSIPSPSVSSGMSASSSYSDHSFLGHTEMISDSESEGFHFTREPTYDEAQGKGALASPALVSPHLMDRSTRASVISNASTVYERPHGDRDDRTSFASTSTSRPSQVYSPQGSSHSAHTTPKQGSRSPDMQSTPSFSRLAFIAPPDVSRKSLEALETEMDAAGISDHGKGRLRGGEKSAEGVRSAPAWKTEFGPDKSPPRRDGEEGSSSQDSTLKGRQKNRRTLPAAASNAALVEALAATSEPGPTRSKPHLRETPSPRRSMDEGPVRRDSREVQLRPGSGRLMSPSPEPPPRSLRRGHDVRAGMSPDPSRSPSIGPGSPLVGSFISVSPKSKSLPLPAVPSPLTMSPPATNSPPLVESSSVPPPRLVNSSTITDLSNLLGEAIDEIGLVNSMELVPADIIQPPKEKPTMHLRLAARDRSSSLQDSGPVTPSTLPTRNASLPMSENASASSSTAMLPPPLKPAYSQQAVVPTDYASQPLHRQYPDYQSRPNAVRKASSILSLRSTVTHAPVPFANNASRPWPAAMLFGHIKTLKNAGDRAQGYARGINDIARADTGIREWCEAVRRTPVKHRPSLPPTKSGYAALSVSSFNGPSYPSNYVDGAHSRQTSAQSEFPMRADAYTAREISVRNIDPANPPNALPPNLPFPQLQQAQTGGMRASPSTQSMSSLGGRKGFFSNIGRRGSGKKDKEATLGPPTQKRDVRNLAISPPQGNVSRFSGLAEASKTQTTGTSPQGPRPPRSSNASENPPTALQRGFTATEYAGRGSLDASLARMSSGRDSIDSTAGRKLSAPMTGSPLVNDRDVNDMLEILPLADPATLRRYLARYGDQVAAIGAYVEDDKRGALLR